MIHPKDSRSDAEVTDAFAVDCNFETHADRFASNLLQVNPQPLLPRSGDLLGEPCPLTMSDR